MAFFFFRRTFAKLGKQELIIWIIGSVPKGKVSVGCHGRAPVGLWEKGYDNHQATSLGFVNICFISQSYRAAY